MFQRKGSGFTLIELMVVIAIIGILSSIIITSLGAARARGRDSKRISDLNNIKLGLEEYYSDNGMYPIDIYAGAGTPPAEGLAPTYISVMPYDPSDNTTKYTYSAIPVGSGPCSAVNPPTRYHLGVPLEQTNNAVLLTDVDFDTGASAATCSNGSPAFSGTSAATAPGLCNATAGTAQTSLGGTETCYDLINN